MDPRWGRVIHQTLPSLSPLSPRPYRKGLGTKLGRGSSAISEILSRTHKLHMHDVSDRILFEPNWRLKTLTSQLCPQLFQETSRPYQAFVHHTVRQSKSSENSSPGCKMSILYPVGPAPCDKKEHQTRLWTGLNKSSRRLVCREM